MKTQNIKLVCGRTRSGKEIFYTLAPPEELEGRAHSNDFTKADDIFDAYALFVFLEWRELDLIGKTASSVLFNVNSNFFRQRLSNQRILSKMKRALGIKNKLDLLEFGRGIYSSFHP